MINKKLLFSVRESIPFIKKNVLYQWIGLVCNVLSTACLCWIITRHRSISLVGILFICLILRYIVNQKAIEMSYESSHIVKETLRSRLYKKLSKIGNSYTNEWSTAEIVQLSTEGIEQLETYFASYIPQFFYSLIAPMTFFYGSESRFSFTYMCSFDSYVDCVCTKICEKIIESVLGAIYKVGG